jgi:hypothetical protein
VIAHAIEWYLSKGINDEPEVKRRYEEAQQAKILAKK